MQFLPGESPQGQRLTPQQLQHIQAVQQARFQQLQRGQAAQAQPSPSPAQAIQGRGVQKRTSVSLNDGDAQARNAKRKRATDRHLPLFQPEDPSPTKESDQALHAMSLAYSKLETLERKLDWTIARKRVDLQESLGSSGLFAASGVTKGGKLTKWRKDLRVRLAHHIDEAQKTWTLKVEASIHDVPEKKFSHLVSSAAVQWVPEDGSDAPDPVSWAASAETPAEGLSITRTYTSLPVKVDVSLNLSQYPERYKVLPQLAQIIGVQEDSQQGILLALWAYIKTNNLQDPENKGIIRLDATLRQFIPSQNGMTFFNHLSEWVVRSLTKPDPAVFNHTISLDSQDSSCFAIPVDIEDPARPRLQDILDGLTSSERTARILNHDAQLADLSAKVHTHHRTRDFLAAFAADPKEFIRIWLEAQAADLDTYLSPQDKSHVLGASAEEMRKAAFWKGGWAEDALNVYAARMAAGLTDQQGQIAGK